MHNVIAAFGIAAILAVAFLLSAERGRVNWRPVLAALGLQLAVAAVFFLTPGTAAVFNVLNDAMLAVLDRANDGIESALTVRPYLKRMTRSELFLVLTVGMATAASAYAR